MKLKYILPIVLGIGFTSACKKDFLELAPISDASADNFYKTASDLNNALSAAYGALQLNGQYGQYYVVSEIPSDDTFPVLSGSVTDQDEFDKFYIRTTNPFLLSRWSDGYRGIYRCNAVIDRSGGVQMNEELKQRYVGEAKFLRALMYFNLVRVFGDVPLVLKEIKNAQEGYDYGRSPVAEVYGQIIADLTEAEQVLPATYPSADVGRATSGAAKSLLGKVYLTQRKYSESAQKLKEVIDSKVYDLLPNYPDVFRASNKNHKESVFAVQYKKGTIGEGSGFGNLYAPENSGNVVILFGGDGNNRPTTDLEKAYEAGDVRRSYSMANSYVNAAGQTISYYFVKKYNDVPNVKYDSDDNFPVIRYADVLLMYAEALNEMGYQPNGEAFNLLNQIRKRAGIPEKTSTELPTQESFRQAIAQERRVELAFEGHRWFDLVRTGKALEVLGAKATEMGIKTSLTENNLIFPIPQSQIDINPSKIKQNQGY